ncbi:MAG: hypothetical protein V5A20_07070 [Salinibacter sp.]|jgi:hypothetical protein|uniref:hypothetical protein n=1 Tax=Salinibacter sp. TaxID=2065818 RepID=UPI002FC2AAE3
MIDRNERRTTDRMPAWIVGLLLAVGTLGLVGCSGGPVEPGAAWGVVRLAETGRIELDEPALRYVKDWEPPDADGACSSLPAS